MSEYTIPRSKQALNIQVWSILIATIATGLLTFMLIRVLYRVTSSARWHAGILAFLVVVAIGYIAALVLQKKWANVSYKLTPDSIIATNSSGFLATSHDVYLYESIISATMTQDYMGKKHDYGDIVLKIPKLDSVVILKSVNNPEKQLKELKNRLKGRAQRQTLVT